MRSGASAGETASQIAASRSMAPSSGAAPAGSSGSGLSEEIAQA